MSFAEHYVELIKEEVQSYCYKRPDIYLRPGLLSQHLGLVTEVGFDWSAWEIFQYQWKMLKRIGEISINRSYGHHFGHPSHYPHRRNGKSVSALLRLVTAFSGDNE